GEFLSRAGSGECAAEARLEKGRFLREQVRKVNARDFCESNGTSMLHQGKGVIVRFRLGALLMLVVMSAGVAEAAGVRVVHRCTRKEFTRCWTSRTGARSIMCASSPAQRGMRRRYASISYRSTHHRQRC